MRAGLPALTFDEQINLKARACWFFPRQAATAGGWVRCPRLVDGALLGFREFARGRLGAIWEARLARVGGLALPLHDRAIDIGDAEKAERSDFITVLASGEISG